MQVLSLLLLLAVARFEYCICFALACGALSWIFYRMQRFSQVKNLALIFAKIFKYASYAGAAFVISIILVLILLFSMDPDYHHPGSADLFAMVRPVLKRLNLIP